MPRLAPRNRQSVESRHDMFLYSFNLPLMAPLMAEGGELRVSPPPGLTVSTPEGIRIIKLGCHENAFQRSPKRDR